MIGASLAGFYRQTPHLMLSSVGMGTYLGDVDQDTDAALEEAIYRAVSEGKSKTVLLLFLVDFDIFYGSAPPHRWY